MTAVTAPPAQPAQRTSPRTPAWSRWANRHRKWLFAGPAMAFVAVLIIFPLGWTVYLSLTDAEGSVRAAKSFIGLGNYLDVLTDSAFHAGLGNVASFVLVHIPIMLGLALGLALLIDSAVVRLRRLWSLAVFLPYAVPTVITGLIWAYLYSPNSGLTALLPFDPLGKSGILPSIVNIATWQWVGYNMIIFYTALQAVPRDVLEAARADGAGGLRTAWSIKVPMIRPTMFVALVFTVIGSLQLFTEPLVLRGFTGSVTSTWSPSLYVYEAAFIAGDYGRAAAASVLLAVVSALLSALVMRLSARRSR